MFIVLFHATILFVFFKQKTAYEMRISDWSSDVCSSDLHLIVVSSLAAREPHLSSYAASKRAGEIAAREVFAGRLTIVRPSVIYGPGDRETLAIFKLAGQTLVPSVGKGTGRIALIHVSDAADVLAALQIGRASCRERVCQYV